MTNPNARLIAYCRVSTREQADSGLGLEAQRTTILGAEKSAPWVVHDWATDAGISGSKVGPALYRALDACKRGDADGIVVAKLDRLSRSLVHFADILARSKREGWALVALDLGVDTTTPAGELVATVMAAVAQWERETIRERTRAGLAEAKRNGKQLGATRTTSDATVTAVLGLREQGLSLRETALELNRLGVPTARGKRWCIGSVRHVERTYGVEV